MTNLSRHSEILRFEAALCIWEAMLEARPKPELVDVGRKDRIRPWQIELETAFDKIGTVAMRHLAIALADSALTVFDLIGRHHGAEELGLIPYDWEFIPAFVARVDWANGGTADSRTIAADLLAKIWPAFTPEERLELAKMTAAGIDRGYAEADIRSRSARRGIVVTA